MLVSSRYSRTPPTFIRQTLMNTLPAGRSTETFKSLSPTFSSVSGRV